jgi:hypothetical protein
MAEFFTDEQLGTPKEGTIAYVLWEFGNEMQTKLREQLRSDDAYVSGDLAEHIEFETKILGTNMVFQLSLEDYFDYVNKGVNGTEQNRNSPYSYGSIKAPPPSKLARWGLNRGIVRGAKEAKSFGFAVSKSIQKKGTKGNKFYDKVVTQDRLKKLSRDISKAAAKDVSTLIAKTTTGLFGRIA